MKAGWGRAVLAATIVWLVAPTSVGWAMATPNVVDVRTNWVLPLRNDHFFNLHPLERTQPVIFGDMVFVAGLNRQLVAVHRTEGRELWRRTLPASVEGALGYGRSKVVVGTSDGDLFAFEAHDGSDAWQQHISSQWLTPPTILRDRVLVASSADEIYCFAERDGKEVWHYGRRGEISEKMTIRGSSSPAVYNNDVYLGFSDGAIASIALATGQPNWVRQLRVRRSFSDIDMRPYVDEQSVIVGTYDGRLYSLNRATGETRWTFQAGTYGGVVVDKDRVYFPGLNGSFYALDKTTGATVWSQPVEMDVGLLPVKVGDYLVFAASNDPIVVLDSRNGDRVGSFNLGAGTMAPVATAEGALFAFSNFGKLYSFEFAPRRFFQKGPETIPMPSALYRVASVVDR